MRSKTKRARAVKTPADPLDIPAILKRTPAAVEVAPQAPQPKRRRRRRRRSALLADRTISAIKAKERDFLREVSAMLTNAIGFPVRVSRVKLDEPMSPDMRRAKRFSRAKAKAQMADAFSPLEMVP